MARTLVTGGTGFIGANLVRRLVRDGHEVHLIVRSHHETWRLEGLRDAVTLHICDLVNETQIRQTLVAVRPQWLFHLAASGAYSWQRDVAQMIQVNVQATTTLLAAANDAGVERFIHAGSSSEYGYKNHPCAEDETLEPNSEYAVTKAAATHLCCLAAQRDNRRVITLRLYSIFGPYEDPRRLIPTLITAGLEKKLPPLVSPETARDFVYIDDAVEAFILAATHPAPPHAVYNIGSGVQTTLAQVVESARKLMTITASPIWGNMPARPWDTSCWISDPRRIETDLGWRAKTPFEQGFAQTLQWFHRRNTI